MYIIRLDDASEYMDTEKWTRMEELLDLYGIKPIVGIIPKNEDPAMVGLYEKDFLFWAKAVEWQNKEWHIALHGYTHVCKTCVEKGLNPVHKRSEFVGVSLDEQKKKIREGTKILLDKNLTATIFFAPAHTFDRNTLLAIESESDIRIISDTIANDIYTEYCFTFIPQQSGRVRKLPFKVTTFCYHPNTMEEEDFKFLDEFLKRNRNLFQSLDSKDFPDRKKQSIDKILTSLYFIMRKLRS